MERSQYINYFFEVVVPQLLDYFGKNAKNVPIYLLYDLLKSCGRYEEEIEKMQKLATKISQNVNKNDYKN